MGWKRGFYELETRLFWAGNAAVLAWKRGVFAFKKAANRRQKRGVFVSKKAANLGHIG